jgi:syntaxin 1B/2/3
MSQYGGYNQVGYGTNPYDQREDGQAAPDAGRFNNYAQGRYDDRTFYESSSCGLALT